MAESRTYPSRPWIGVGAVIWRGDDVLLVKRGKPPREGEWSLPGGAQHLGETVIAAAQREVREETGMNVEIQGVIDAVDAIERDDDGRVSFHFTLVDVLGDWQSGEGTPGDDVTEIRWMPFAHLSEIELWAETRRVIEMAVRFRAVQPWKDKR